MKRFAFARFNSVIPAILILAGLLALGLWLRGGTDRRLGLRIPGTDQSPGSDLGSFSNAVLAGRLVRSDGQPANLPGAWPRFRGPNGDAISREPGNLARGWQSSEPRELWAIDVGEGYAGPAVFNGRVFLMDYDRAEKRDALRCLSLADGREIWRYTYPVSIKRNHGMSRTVPAVTEQIVVAIGPKCHVLCCDAVSGDLRWSFDLTRDFGATIPQWYAGQCPLIDNNKVILAPGGKDALLTAVDGETGKVLWRTPNPRDWKMTHSSVVPLEFAGQRMYVYCASGGVVGVSASDGAILWDTTEWKISIATVPSPVILDGGRILLSGGYGAGSLMLRVEESGGKFAAKALFRLGPEIFGATQHSPILHQEHFYGVRPDGKFVCVDLNGKPIWASDGQPFGLGSFVMANDLIFALNDSGWLRLIEARPDKYHLLAQAQVLRGRESWGPMALAGGRLLARDLTRLVCLDVNQH